MVPALVVVIAAACAGSKSAPRPATVSPQSFAPPDTLAAKVFNFAQDTVLSPLLAQWPREDSSKSGTGDPSSDGETEAETMVYRVQLTTTKDLSAAQAARVKAQSEFKQDVQIDYEIPYYKVRLGSFVSPQAAEPLLNEARRLGYQGAWAVRVRASQQAP